MLTPGWVCWTIWFLSIGVKSVVGDEGLSQPTCLARDETDEQLATIQWPMCVDDQWTDREVESVTSTSTTTVAATATDSPSTGGVDGQAGQEDLDTESPLDNANFLSFEDWKKQNLAKVGQSVENVGGSRRSGKEPRGRPTGINNALDSLGEDTEIELDFGGFGTGAQEAAAATAKPTAWDTAVPPGSGLDGASNGDRHIDEESALAHSVPRTGMSRRKDAGTTCKERFNYASFDCAATVLKTNSEGTGSSSVLIENKDSYMLNECQAQNKFLILELCDDILVDTVVLANYEFFSSIFHTFRVSVSDRYPAKLDQWKELGVYEARNTREVQAFAVENPLIWARYLKIEFLTHYGHEFYCPLSLIRVHGTTMLEEYKHDGDVGHEVVVDETLEANPAMVEGNANHVHDFPATTTELDSTASAEVWFNREKEIETLLLTGPFGMTNTCGIHATSADAAGFGELAQSVDSTVPDINDTSSASSADDTATTLSGTDAASKEATVDVQRASGLLNSSSTTATVVSETAQQNEAEADSHKEDVGSPSPEVIRSTTTTTTSTSQPPSPNPTTQESFFKSVNKRLQMLESNSTLSLLYIEEQSRILRDAFNKVEKRQLAKTSTFLENLNQTVLDELKHFREQYDQVWKTVLLEFEHQRIHHHQEMYAMSGQLGVLADELVFQKRVAVVQSIMVLVCFGLILFSPRGVVGSYIDFPSVQNMVSRSYSMRSSSPTFESPSMSPSSTRPISSYRSHNQHHRHQHPHHRRNISDDSQNGGLPSPTIAYSPPTPTSPTSDEEREERRDGDGDTDALAMSPVESHVRSSSSPPVLNGCVAGDADADEEYLEAPASLTSPT